MLVLLASLMLACFAGFAQKPSELHIQGVVLDKDGEPFVGASVMVKEKELGTMTDLDGYFILNVPINSILEVSFIGYQTYELVIRDENKLRIVLQEENMNLDDAVVVAFGTQKKETITGAISQVSGSELVKSPVADVSNALAGRVAGLSYIQQTGEPGFTQATIRVRGVGTFDGNVEPLIVIDGIVRDMTSFTMLDANDIQSINVLKDASATAVYGVRGANGVIIVTTKRGKEWQPQVSLTANFGFMTPTDLPDLVNSYDYAVLRNEAYRNEGKYTDARIFTEDELWKFYNNRDYTPAEIEAMHISDEQKQALMNSPAIYYGSTDFMEEIFGNSYSPQQQYNVNISGGTQDVLYYTSVGYNNQRSFVNDFGFNGGSSDLGNEQYNFRSNFDFKSIPDTEINVSVSGQFRFSEFLAGNDGDAEIGLRYKDMMQMVYQAPPYSYYGLYDGKIVSSFSGGSIMDTAKHSEVQSPIVGLINRKQTTINRYGINTSFRAVHKMDYLLKGLSLRGALSYDHFLSKSITYTPNHPTFSIMRNPENLSEIMLFGGGENPGGLNESAWNKNHKLYVETGIEYSGKFNKHNVGALLLLTGEKYTAPGLQYNVPKGVYGLVGRITYDYDKRYLLEFNAGYNGSENFAPEDRFGFFPSISAGWVISNEPFFPKNNVVTRLKIRGSYGQTGNSNLSNGRFLFLPSSWAQRSFSQEQGHGCNGYFFGYTDGTTKNPAFPGKYESTSGNPDAKWEKKDSYNLGLELKMFKNRLTANVDAFLEQRNNILTRLEVTPDIIGLAGNALPPMNVGRMRNQGYEVELAWRDNLPSGFWYAVTSQVSYAVNKVEYRAEPLYKYPWMNKTGFAVGQYKAYSNEGFYNTPQEVANHPYNDVGGNVVCGGDLRIVDVDGDGKVDINDMVPVGFSNLPRFSFGGNISMGYKGFDISVLLSGSAQGSFLMNGYIICPFNVEKSTPLEYMKNRWTPERYAAGELIEYPRMSTNIISTQNGPSNSFWVRSSSHVKLKNIEVAYTFRKANWMRATQISGIRVFFSTNNLLTISFGDLIDGIDPELVSTNQSAQGIIYPLSRVYNCGFNVKF